MIKTLIILFFLFFHSAYSQNIIKGDYSTIDSKCKLNLKIAANNYFVFDSGKKKVKGILKISKEDNILYIDFINGIGGMLQNDTISIQNSGNTVNEYTHFKECDEKYIHLVKKNNVRVMKDRYCNKKNKKK
ncbi:hypothetical protein CLU96_3682 [Chryseobacterium sp. 52]|nr:hypothetical protein CLU96_3682 [Chryseobacterium sp. 52]